MFLSKSKKSPYYQLTYLIDGKRTTVSTKAVTKRDAEKFLFNFQLNSTIKAETEIPPISTLLNLESFKSEYLAYCKRIKSVRYTVSIEYAFRQLITYANNIPITDVDIRIVDNFITQTFARTQRGSHQYYRTLKAAFNKAVEWNYIAINPFSKVKFPRLPRSYPTFVTEDELLIILANTKHKYLKDIFTVAFYTGMRLGELINMRWDWVAFLQNQITVKCSDAFLTKSKKERIVPMCEKVRRILDERFQNKSQHLHEVVFYKTGHKLLYQGYISKQFKAIVRISNLNEKIHFHSLRHSFCSLLVQKGVSLYVVKELVGHEDLATKQIYSHLQNQNLKDAVDLL